MDSAYQTWFWVLVGGVVLGAFLRPRVVALIAAALFAAAVFGLVVAAVLGYGTATTLFGLAAVAIPVLGAVAVAGAAISGLIWRGKSK